MVVGVQPLHPHPFLMPIVRRLFPLLLLSLFLGFMSAPARSAESHEALADAMARMMEAMGFRAADPSDSNPFDGAPARALPGWPSGFSAWSNLAPPAVFGGNQEPFQPWGPRTFLEGVWESNDGGLLIVQGHYYRLYAPCKGHIDGGIRVESERIELTNARQGFSQHFEYAQDQGRLALRDQQGRIFVYRRLVLDGGLGFGH